ncbi:DoxX family protein [Mycolicibacterium aichiense]|uniref:Membrane protein n=1 Tax=Mycolicibacterium aichiense TaxID=1799 RepID=A0AAD1MD83_9MYCO|nr:DoxX family protein [Mycolicibacterium aichiense]MCV7018893.1 DoxX family protein [Mycolicibacterium aichiense]BBX08566.1 membrane protein [Mycolicibacterium aichiense]STZ82362.1 integral membrane protein [Mycolicibacterium aichiense]
MAQTLDARLGGYHSPVLGIFRIVIGLLFALHGAVKLFGWPISQGGAAPIGSWPYWWAGVIELVVGLLVALGLFTRIAALIGSGEMAFAYFTQHQPHGLLPIQNDGELAVLYCFALFLLAFAGPGAFAVQGGRFRR